MNLKEIIFIAELKTKLNKESVEKFLNSVPDAKKRKDSFIVLELMKKITKEEPKMWGSSIVGFGPYHYKYESEREGDWFLVGFSPRKQNLTIYIMPDFGKYKELMEKSGKYKIAKSCLYINRLEEIKLNVLQDLIRESFQYMNKRYGK